MIEFSTIVVKAYEGHDIHNEFYRQTEGGDSLVVIFPGGNYSCDRPLLHYARKAALLCGHDVLCISYGRNKVNKEVPFLELEVKESFEAIKKCMTPNYKNIFFVSKSLGTTISGRISKEMGYDKVKSIYMTPLSEALEHITSTKCIVIAGTNDKFLPQESITYLKQYDNVELYLFEGARHSMELDDDLEGCLKILGDVTHICERIFREKN